jgi:serine phosphatase RsbU (regulator of sigma subunit)
MAVMDRKFFISASRLDFLKFRAAGKEFLRELNYLIPVQLKKTGFEIIRAEEDISIDQDLIKKLARAIHSIYGQELRKLNSCTDKTLQEIPEDFDKLPKDLIYSNIDNAYHIPTKLLSIGYRIRPVQKGFRPFTLRLDETEIETMARIEHLRWIWDKRLNGWIHGNIRDDDLKIHPDLIPYEQLSETEKEKDRELVKLIPSLLQDIGYVAYPVVPGTIRNLSYAIRPQSSINRLLDETRMLNDEISEMSVGHSAVGEKLRIIREKIGETIDEVRGNYNYAQHIQQSYLPGDLYIRECFPDSFVLFGPKDIVSGDFYFFSKQGHLVIFAAADCTGHGIPGALLSTLGYGITDQAVNEKKFTDPADILHHLYLKVHRFLRKDEDRTGITDDMDIAVCTLDVKSGLLKYAGVGNPIYLVSAGNLTEYKARNSDQDCIPSGEGPFVSDIIQTSPGDTIYLFSDGYTDQFGGSDHKKYQRSRFKSFLLSIQNLSMPEQRDRLYEEFELWRSEKDEDQTDDILVIGVRL